MKAAVIGGGVMGEAILAAALAGGVFHRADVMVAEVVQSRREHLAATHGVAVIESPADAMEHADLIVLAVKPQDAARAAGAVRPEAVILSIMAGVTLATIGSLFSHDRLVRVMPNTPVAVREGMSVWTATESVTGEQREATRALLASFGQELYVDDESKIDMATAMNGSGPAYLFLFVEAMVEAGVNIGLTRAQSQQLANQTVYGSALYVRESGAAAGELRAAVTSPGGTTAAALLQLERHAFRAAIIDAVRAAYDRAKELGRSQ